MATIRRRALSSPPLPGTNLSILSKGMLLIAVPLAFARSEDRQRALLAGYQAHVAKPVEPAELVTLVASLTGRITAW